MGKYADTLMPVVASAMLGMSLGEVTMHSAAVGGFAGAVLGREILVKLNRLADEYRVSRVQSVSTDGLVRSDLTGDSSRRRVL